MYWSKWQGSLAILLACVVLACAQPAVTTNATELDNHDIYLMLAEPGKAPQKCRLLYCWHMEDGLKACQVQNVETGELMTIIDPPLPVDAPELIADQPGAMQPKRKIYHWGSSRTAPAGFPQPPAGIASQPCTTCGQNPAFTCNTPYATSSPVQNQVVVGETCCTPMPEQVVIAEPATSIKPVPQRPGLLKKLFGGNSERPVTTVTQPKVPSPAAPVRIVKDDGSSGPTSLADLAKDTPAGTASTTQPKFVASTTTYPGTGQSTVPYPGAPQIVPSASGSAIPGHIAPQSPYATTENGNAGPNAVGTPQAPGALPGTGSVPAPATGNTVPNSGGNVVAPPASGANTTIPGKGNTNPPASAGSAFAMPATPNAGLTPSPSATAVASNPNVANLPPIPPPPSMVAYPGYQGTMPAKKNDIAKLPGADQPPLPANKTAPANKTDPLGNANDLIPDAAKKKLEIKSAPSTASGGPDNKGFTSGMSTGTGGTAGAPGTKSVDAPYAGGVATPSYATMPMQKPGAWTTPGGQNYGVPLGAQSANAAYSGMNLPVKYLPTPIVTVPSPTAPPFPPPPEIPHAPQPVAYENAFSAPEPPRNGQNSGGYSNPMMAMNPYAYPYGHPMMAPPGYGMSPAMMYSQTPMMAQGNPYGYAATPANPMGLSRNYSGPLPPSPISSPNVAQVSYQPYGVPGYASQPGYYANPAMDRPAQPMAPHASIAADDAVFQMLTTLKTSVYPAHREWAAMGLGKYDWHNHPYLVQGLLVAAKEDPAATVRVTCVQTLVRQGVSREIFAATFQSMQSDIDPRVRQAVAEALGASQPASPSAAVTPVEHKESQ
jgi:hypothetical protein